MKVVSTCKMDVHKFPFDTQSCNLSIGSALHCGGGTCVCTCVRCLALFFDGWRFWVSVLTSVSEFRLIPSSNASRATQFSHEVLRSQGEWEFLHLSITKANFTYNGKTWEQLTYTVRTKLKSDFSKPVLKGADEEVVICDALNTQSNLIVAVINPIVIHMFIIISFYNSTEALFRNSVNVKQVLPKSGSK